MHLLLLMPFFFGYQVHSIDIICWFGFVHFSATPGGLLDRAIDAEDERHQDFLRLVCSPTAADHSVGIFGQIFLLV